jgi:hypothetical protein
MSIVALKPLKIAALAAAAFTASLAAVPSAPAEAHGPRIGIFIGAPGFYGHSGYYRPYHSCHWLKRQYWRTGNYYWWQRYQDCRMGY